MIQIRNVPDKLHRKLKARAALLGLSLSDFLLQEISAVADRPTREELLQRLSERSPVVTEQDPTDALRAERGAR